MPSPACLVGKIEVQDPFLLVVEAVAQRCSIKNVFLKIRKIHMETLCQSLFLMKLQTWRLQLYYKRDSDTCVFLGILRNF